MLARRGSKPGHKGGWQQRLEAGREPRPRSLQREPGSADTVAFGLWPPGHRVLGNSWRGAGRGEAGRRREGKRNTAQVCV